MPLNLAQAVFMMLLMFTVMQKRKTSWVSMNTLSFKLEKSCVASVLPTMAKGTIGTGDPMSWLRLRISKDTKAGVVELCAGLWFVSCCRASRAHKCAAGSDLCSASLSKERARAILL